MAVETGLNYNWGSHLSFTLESLSLSSSFASGIGNEWVLGYEMVVAVHTI